MHLLWWAFLALIISIIAGALGFSGVAAGAAVVAKVFFFVFLVIFFVLLFLVLLGYRALFG